MKIERRIRVTKRAVDALKPGEWAWDSDLAGFYARCLPSGKVSYGVTYRSVIERRGRHGRQRWVSLGLHGAKVTPEQARRKAKLILGDVAKNRDPGAERDAARDAGQHDDTLKSHVGMYLVQAERRLKPRSYLEVKRHLDRLTDKHGATPIGQVTRKDVSKLLDAIVAEGHGVQANRHKATIGAFFKWAVGRGYVEASPVAFMPDPYEGEEPRERVLSDDELATIWRASYRVDWPYGPIVRMLALTGCRREEVGAMAWTELDLNAKEWRIPARRTKAGRDHVVPLTDAMLAIIADAKPRTHECPFVFSPDGTARTYQTYSDGKEAIDTAIAALGAVDAWRLHDLRRTLTSGLQRMAVSEPVLRAVLNHSASSALGVTAVYARHDFADEKRQALVQWSEHLLSLSRPKATVSAAI